MGQSTSMTSVTRCCVTAISQIRYEVVCREWKHNLRRIILLPLITVHLHIIEISTRYAVEVKYVTALSGLPP